jgi:peptide/nickel transport system ATP-binding protein
VIQQAAPTAKADRTSRVVSLLRQHPQSVRLQVKDLRAYYRAEHGFIKAVDGVSFEVNPGEYLGVVGESGCGKTSLVKALFRLLPDDASVDGHVLLDGRDLLAMDWGELRTVRWRRMSLITQSAMNSLDPVYRVGDQIVEAIRYHLEVSKEDARHRSAELFELVGLPPERLRNYPHQFSGGMRQRVVIAMALALEPGLIVADEPTTALDVISQDQVLERIRRIQRAVNASMFLVTHDISVIAETCHNAAVMYAGKIVEIGSTGAVFREPLHPYTMGLKNSFPDIKRRADKLVAIPGSPPNLADPPSGCLFAERCPFVAELCRIADPPLRTILPGHAAACHYAERAAELRQHARYKETWAQVAGRLGGEAQKSTR